MLRVCWSDLSCVNRNEDYPNYKPGLWACLACCLLTIILVGILSITYKADEEGGGGLEYDIGGEEGE